MTKAYLIAQIRERISTLYTPGEVAYRNSEKIAIDMERLCDSLEDAVMALDSIACKHVAKQVLKSWWKNHQTHEACAETLALDTSIARDCLSKLKKEKIV